MIECHWVGLVAMGLACVSIGIEIGKWFARVERSGK